MLQAKIESILRPDVFRIIIDSTNVTQILFDRRILYHINEFDDSNLLMDKLKAVCQKRTVNILRSHNLSKGLSTGRIYIDGKHLSSYLK